MNAYSIAGLRVSSDIAIPGAIAQDGPWATPDVRLAAGPTPLQLEDPTRQGPTWQATDSRFLLRLPGLIRFVIDGGREIVFELEEDGLLADAPAFLMWAFGVLLHQRGQIVLHASAVRIGGRAVLFCGPSGSGKSTLAAALAERGHPVIADDVCALSMDGGPVLVQPDGRSLKLWENTIEALDLGGQRGAAVRERLGKFYVAPAEAFCDPCPLGAIYVLRQERPPHAAGIERPNIAETAHILRRNAYRPRLVERLGQLEAYFHASARIAETAGVFTLTRPFGFDHMPRVLDQLERHWAEQKLEEAAA